VGSSPGGSAGERFSAQETLPHHSGIVPAEMAFARWRFPAGAFSDAAAGSW
jgi:hypothetical protein